MPEQIKPGSRWGSATCNTEVVVVRAPSEPVQLECGGQPMSCPPPSRQGDLPSPTGTASGTLLGKRYVDAASGLEVLCTKPGGGALQASGRPMTAKDAKALPSSD
ncbi:MAG: hypothetical protein AB7O55_28640 [Lautropia sp.]